MPPNLPKSTQYVYVVPQPESLKNYIEILKLKGENLAFKIKYAETFKYSHCTCNILRTNMWRNKSPTEQKHTQIPLENLPRE